MWSAPENTRICRVDRTGLSDPTAVAILGALNKTFIAKLGILAMMDEIEIIRLRAEAMSDAHLLRCIGDGPDSYRPGVYEIYLRESARRGIKPVEARKARHEAAKSSRIGDYVWGYLFSIILITAPFHFFSLASRLRRHRSGKAIIDGNALKHVVTQFWISAGQATLIVVSLCAVLFRLHA